MKKLRHPDKQKLSEFISTKADLHKTLKEVLQVEMRRGYTVTYISGKGNYIGSTKVYIIVILLCISTFYFA